MGGGYWYQVGIEQGTCWVWGERGGWEGKEKVERGELMEKYSEAPCEVRISREGLLAALIICMYYVKLSWQRGELPCELSKLRSGRQTRSCSAPATCTA